MAKVYYKVVNDYLESVIVNTAKLKTQYKIGKFVSSPVPETPLCVFEDLESAIRFKNVNIGRSAGSIYKCDIKNKLRKPWIPYFEHWDAYQHHMNLKKLISLIKGHKKYLKYVWTDMPRGTVCAKQVKLLEKVDL